MTTINIAGLTPVNDPAYRYKMPKLVGKVEGRGNGIKTVLVNVKEVGDSLKREAPEITKFFGCELGAQTSYAADTDRAIVNGSHRDGDLQNHLSRYIENFVLCSSCRLPETHYKIKEGLISQKCLACGHREPVDMTHKLTTFILAQHKKNKELQKAAEKADKKDKKDKDKTDKKEKDKKEKIGKVEETPSTTSVNTSNDGEKDKAEKNGKKTSSSKASKSALKTTSGEGENKGTVFGFVPEGNSNDDDESDSKAADEGIERLKLYLSNHPDATLPQLLDELRNIQTMASLRPADRMILYLGAVFPENFLSANFISTHKDTLAALAGSEIQQRQLIAAFEWLVGTRYPSLSKNFVKVLKQLYDEDLVEEDVFFQWAADVTRNEFSAEQSMMTYETLEKLRDVAQPFITWLQEAEEEGDADEDGEEEEDEEDEEASK